MNFVNVDLVLQQEDDAQEAWEAERTPEAWEAYVEAAKVAQPYRAERGRARMQAQIDNMNDVEFALFRSLID